MRLVVITGCGEHHDQLGETIALGSGVLTINSQSACFAQIYSQSTLLAQVMENVIPITFEAFHGELERATDKEYADLVTCIAKETFDRRNAQIPDDVERLLNRPTQEFTEHALKAAKTDFWNLAA